MGIFFAQVDVAVFGLHGVAGQDHGLHHQEGIVFEQGAVFEGAGFALVGVADNDLVRAGHLARLPPLAAHIVAGPAPSLDVRLADDFDDVLAGEADGFFQGGKPADGFVRCQRTRIVAAEIPGDETDGMLWHGAPSLFEAAQDFFHLFAAGDGTVDGLVDADGGARSHAPSRGLLPDRSGRRKWHGRALCRDLLEHGEQAAAMAYLAGDAGADLDGIFGAGGLVQRGKKGNDVEHLGGGQVQAFGYGVAAGRGR